MPHIRITSAPVGEAPLSIRECWVGLLLPIADGTSITPKKIKGSGVLTGPRSFWPSIRALLTKNYEVYDGYLVEAIEAVFVLEQSNPEAAQWWLQNARHLLAPRMNLIFPTDCCHIEDEAAL